MKKKNFLSSLLLIILSSLSLEMKAQNIKLSGRLKGLSDGMVTIFYNKENGSETDTVKAANDVFTWKTNSNEPLLLALTAGHNLYFFFAEPGNIKLTGIIDSTQSYKISGSPMQHDAETFKASIKDLTAQRDSLNDRFRTASKEEKEAINKKGDDLNKQLYNRASQFIAGHPKSFYSLYLITLYREYNEIKPLYDKLDATAKQTFRGKKIGQLLEKLAKGQIGMQMENFIQPDTSGNPVKLESFKGKYVLVDFWASWCMPCRAENPNVVKAYNAYKDKGFTVIGISLDDKAANWKKAIRADKMPWTQLSDLKGWKNDLAVSLGIQAIPSNFLIDPSGKIVAKDLRGVMLENKLKELLN